MVYQWKSNTPYTPKVDAQTAGEICEKLSSENRLNASELVNISRPDDAPLHKAFEWDDTIAGEEWRRHQARNLINALFISEPEAQHEPVRGFFKLERKAETYETLDTILRKPDKYEALLATARSELAAFSRKYRALSELEPVFQAIDTWLQV